MKKTCYLVQWLIWCGHLAVQSQFSTPASAPKYTTPFSTPARDLPAAPVVVNMPSPAIPDFSPKLRGENGEDNLKIWLSNAKVWFAKTDITCKQSVAERDLVRLFCL